MLIDCCELRMRRTPVGLESVADYPALFAELANRGWTGPELEKLASRNLIRVFRAVEQVSQRWLL